MSRLLIVLLAMALSGCGSAPAYHYTLSPPVALESMTPITGKVGPYSLAEVTVPPEADHASLVVQQTDGHVLMLSNDLWTAPLSAQLQAALSIELTARLGMPPLQNLASGARETDVSRIQVDVQRFDLVPGQYVTIYALWRVHFAGVHKILTCYTRLQQPVGVGVAALVTGQQKNTQKLSAQIADSLVQRAGPADAQCTTQS
jgi:uncharacterized lipoprotein YmbA